jgi:Domain of unknown function (DUF4396)
MGSSNFPPAWLEALAWASLILAMVVAAAISYDEWGRGYRQKMAAMEVVYPVTGLYWGPIALWFYLRFGRRTSWPEVAGERTARGQTPERPRWWQVSTAVTHCGAGCVLGDIGSALLVLGLGITVAGSTLYADVALNFALAWIFGIGFQYFTIAPMRKLSFLEGIGAAVRADTLSIVAFQVGMIAWMFGAQRVLLGASLSKTTATYWLFMQVGMILGFFTAYPVNRWLIERGWKESMS